jgi:hypothetical protein
MTPERRQRILEVAAELEAQGLPATNSAVYAICMGHRGHIVRTLKERRAQRAAAGGVLVAEEEENDEPEDDTTETPAAVLAEDLAQLESAYEGFHLALEKLWALEREGVWDENISNRQTFLEKTLVKNLHEQERVRAALDTARIRENVYTARDQHDDPLPQAQAEAEQTCQALAWLAQCLAGLARRFDTQVDGFFAPRTARGEQYFDVQAGRVYVRQLVADLFPQDFRAPAMVDMLLDTPPQDGNQRAALASCARLKPFSPTAIATYLSQHQTEGSSNGQHS